MKIELAELTEANLQQCFDLKVSDDQMQYIASNEFSWNEAKENETVARPFAIYCDGKMIGFAMFAFDEDYEDPNDRYWLWRFMIGEASQGQGCGTAALQEVIRYFKEHGANNIRLSTKPTNTGALSLYRKAGFRDTGEMNDEEIVLQLDL
ncbi:MAG: GNAT family N-acetyltransferase [Lachnospiraceae bacterium]|nr:GNAT family N-acetyltransferase [Lachnospiraceae bacterium]